MTTRLSSHPHLFLKEHIKQVAQAFQGIFAWHSDKTIDVSIKSILKKLAQFHDLGKGTSFFQEYIKDTVNYCGNMNQKSHTPLSLVLVLMLAQKLRWEQLEILIIAVCIAGHHSRLPTLPSKQVFEETSNWSIDRFASSSLAITLKKQFPSIDFTALQEEISESLGEVASLIETEKPSNIINEAKKYLTHEVMPVFYSLDEQDAIEFRLKAQFSFSILLEGDKAFLAVSDREKYIDRQLKKWKPCWVDERIGNPDDTLTNRLRAQARQEVMNVVNRVSTSDNSIFSLTAPTGCGKTLLAATWALSLREKAAQSVIPKIIVVLPYLSVIDQTAKEYSILLKMGEVEADGSWLLISHSLSDRHYADWLEDNEQAFFIDTWRSEFIITTYDQFLMSLLDPNARYQMRFHNLCDALIIMDEVQSLPCRLWQLLDKVIHSLSEVGNSKVLLMSATLPSFVGQSTPLIADYKEYFKKFSRYKICLRLNESISDIESFCEEMISRLPSWLKNKKRVLITLNTRASARKVRDALEKAWLGGKNDVPLLFVTADITPRDRLITISNIKEGKPCIVISTQCIEAGVDIDMDMVIRDFAPLDSLIQIAGRCHREGRLSGERGIIEIVDLDDGKGTNKKKNKYSEMIYDPIHLQITRDLLEEKNEIFEEDILEFTETYFEMLSKKKDTGYIHVKRFAQWQEDVDVRELLRGKEQKKFDFLVLAQDLTLKDEMIKVSKIEDRWKRREGWKKLASRIAMITVSVYAKPRFYPELIADVFAGQYVLKEGYYSSKKGLLVEGGVDIW